MEMGLGVPNLLDGRLKGVDASLESNYYTYADRSPSVNSRTLVKLYRHPRFLLPRALALLFAFAMN